MYDILLRIPRTEEKVMATSHVHLIYSLCHMNNTKQSFMCVQLHTVSYYSSILAQQLFVLCSH